MDNTELHYLSYDPEAIWETMMLNYVEAGGDIIYPGDEKEMLLRAVQADIVQVFAGVDNALRMRTLRYAQGEYLDVIGDMRGCERIQASEATATVTITTNATGKNIYLEAGTAMTSDGEMFYLLQEDLPLSGIAQTVTVSVIADRTGIEGNGLVAGTEMVLSSTNSGIYSIVAESDATGGNEEEDDETYRERIRSYGLSSVTTGPSRQYESAAKAVSSSIVDAKAVNKGGGIVGIYLIISDQDNKTSIIQSVLTKLSSYDTRPLTDEVHVYEAEHIEYSLDVYCSSDRSSETISALSAAISEYQSWQDNTIGQNFNPDRLVSALYSAGATMVYFGDDSYIGESSDIEYTETDNDKCCKGTITLNESV